MDAWSTTDVRIHKITIDTGCVNAKRADKDLNVLEQWESSGLIKIQRADVFMVELKGPPDRIAKGNKVSPHPGLITLGSGAFGDGNVLSGPDFAHDIQEILFPTTRTLISNQKYDIRHLSQHVRVGGDIFVTLNTKDFIKHGKQAALAERGIWVFTPKEAVGLLKRLYSWT